LYPLPYFSGIFTFCFLVSDLEQVEANTAALERGGELQLSLVERFGKEG